MNRINLMGLDFASSTFEDVINEIQREAYKNVNYHPFVITPNADQVLQLSQSPDLKAFYSNAYFILPDGFPIVLFGKLTNSPLQQKLSGSDLFPILWGFAKTQNKNVFVVSPTENVAELLRKENPTLRYHVSGLLDINDAASFYREANLIIEKIGAQIPDYLIIGLGFPKQEILAKLIYEKILHKKDAPLFILLGASFEFYLKLKKRAPLWMQKIGMEWLHRLMSEPKRLWRRYTIGNIRFALFFTKEYLKSLKL